MSYNRRAPRCIHEGPMETETNKGHLKGTHIHHKGNHEGTLLRWQRSYDRQRPRCTHEGHEVHKYFEIYQIKILKFKSLGGHLDTPQRSPDRYPDMFSKVTQQARRYTHESQGCKVPQSSAVEPPGSLGGQPNTPKQSPDGHP